MSPRRPIAGAASVEISVAGVPARVTRFLVMKSSQCEAQSFKRLLVVKLGDLKPLRQQGNAGD